MSSLFWTKHTPTSPDSSSTFSTTIPIVVSPPTSPKPSSNPSKHSSKTIPTAKHSTSTTKPSTSTPKPQPSPSKSYAEAVRAMGSITDKAHSIRITGEQNPLSNLYKCKLNSQGALWHSVEHRYTNTKEQYSWIKANCLIKSFRPQTLTKSCKLQIIYHTHHWEKNFRSWIPFWSSSMSNAKNFE